MNSRFVSGIDEAGRGPIIGPMIVAGVTMASDKNTLAHWRRIGVDDSKVLSREQRERLFKRVVELPHTIVVVTPKEIDAAVTSPIRSRSLNYLEASKFAQIADTLKTDVVYVDAPDVNMHRFGKLVRRLSVSKPTVVARHHADRDYVVVGAASIIAKVIRDEIIDDLHRQFGDFGSGYPSDPKTRVFLRTLVRRKRLPSWCRKSWKTWGRLKVK